MLMSKEYETYLGFFGDVCLNAEVEERNVHYFFTADVLPLILMESF